MILILFFAVYCIIAGSIEVLPGWRLNGRFARWYGVALLVGSIPASALGTILLGSILLFAGLLFPIDPESLWVTILGFIPTIAIIILFAIPFKVLQGDSVAKSSKPNSRIKLLGCLVALFVCVILPLGVAGYFASTYAQKANIEFEKIAKELEESGEIQPRIKTQSSPPVMKTKSRPG